LEEFHNAGIKPDRTKAIIKSFLDPGTPRFINVTPFVLILGVVVV
jgi:hypothetical protein